MKRILLASTTLVAMSTVALGADMAVRKAPARIVAPATSWTGFYIGAQAGGVWSDASLSGAYTDGIGSSAWSSSQSWTSALIGGFAGYDLQVGQYVVGIEGDINARPGHGTGSLPSVFGIGVTNGWVSKARSDASIRARLGVLATDQFLLYLTGGVAFANFKLSNPNVASENDVYWGTRNIYGGSRTGWTFGGGGQYAIAPHWSVRVEYRHTDFGTKSGSGTFDFGKGGPGSFRAKITDDRVTGGVAYKF
jgi:outer membrane immunogenic protein